MSLAGRRVMVKETMIRIRVRKRMEMATAWGAMMATRTARTMIMTKAIEARIVRCQIREDRMTGIIKGIGVEVGNIPTKTTMAWTEMMMITAYNPATFSISTSFIIRTSIKSTTTQDTGPSPITSHGKYCYPKYSRIQYSSRRSNRISSKSRHKKSRF